MKKAALWLGAAGVVAGLLLTQPVSAAEMFPDVPTEHWAYQAVNNLQERGIVIGYPDGTFGGRRAMTRFEFAVAIDRLVDWVTRSQADLETRLNERIDAIPRNGGTPSTGLTEDQAREIARREIEERLRNLPTREDIETVRRLVDEFRDELAALGTNTEALRRDLDSLKARVGVLEEKVNKWKLSGEGNFIVRGERSDDEFIPGLGTARRPVIDIDQRTDNNFTNNILQDMKTLYSLDLGITGNLGGGVTANALINYGNYLPWVQVSRMNPGVSAQGGFANNGLATDISNVDPVPGGMGPISPLGTDLTRARTITQGNLGSIATNESYSEISPVKLYLSATLDDLLFLRDIDATVGKFGVQFTPYTLRKVDPDSYTSVTLTDNGEYIVTGAMARGRIGSVSLQGYAATHYVGRPGDSSINTGDALFTTWGGPDVLSPDVYGGYPWDQSMGVRGNFSLGRFNIGATYITAGITPTQHLGAAGLPPYSNLNTYANRPNPNNNGELMVPRRAEVYGADINFPLFGKLGFTGEFASSDVLAGTDIGDRESVFITELNNAYDARLTYGSGRLSLSGGYKQVDPYFGTPGSWGRIGRWKNPTNIKGVTASAGYDMGPFTLKGTFEDYESVRVANGLQPGSTFIPNLNDLTQNDIKNYTVGVSFNLNSTNSIDLGWEQARIQPFNGAGETRETYWNIGIGHRFNDNALFKVMYQIVDYEDNGAGLYTVAGGNYKGGIGVTQLSVRF